MTHSDIYTKFMIEYDKANVTSSYPSLTEYEVATVLDKAYNALIAQKVTGNNFRRIGFEMDLKAVEDLAPLIKQLSGVVFTTDNNSIAPNVVKTNLPSDYLYFLDAYLRFIPQHSKYLYSSKRVQIAAYTEVAVEDLPPALVNEDVAVSPKFYVLNVVTSDMFDYDQNHAVRLVSSESHTSRNYKYYVDDVDGDTEIKQGYLTTIGNSLLEHTVYVWTDDPHYEEDNPITIGVYANSKEPYSDGNPMDQLVDRMVPTKLVTHQIAQKFFTSSFNIPWIKVPVSYIEDGVLYVVYDLLNTPQMDDATIVYIKKPNTFVKDLTVPPEGYVTYFEGDGPAYEFECNSTVAEELISLAVTFALENVESQRLNSKLNMRGIEA